MAYKTLVIAPKTDLLLVDDEVQQVINLLGAKVLNGSQATLHGLLTMLREPFDILWFATHGNEQGIYMEDGPLNASELTTMVRSCGASLTVFNTCASRPVALTIHDELQTEFVCTIKKVPDRMAFITGTVFAQKIADGLDFYAAYEAAKPGQNSTYTFLPAKGTVAMPPISKGPTTEPGTTARFEEIVEQLDAIVNGNPRLRITGLADSVDRIDKNVQEIDKRISKIEEEQKFNRRLLIGLLIVVTLVLMLLVIAVFFQGTGA